MQLNTEAKKHPKIHISAIKEKNQYLFSIKDNGIGMSPKHLEQNIYHLSTTSHSRRI